MPRATKKVCPTCGQAVTEYGQKITPGLADALVRFKEAVLYYGRNDIDPSNDMGKGSPFELSFAQRANITILRKHGLLAKVKNPDGSRKMGHWLLTKRGNQFVTGELAIPERVYTLMNQVVRHSDNLVTIKDVWGKEPRFEDSNTMERRAVAPSAVAQPSLLNDN